MRTDEIHAVILAGGLGSRLGGARKSHIRIAGKPLLQRIADGFSEIATPLLISLGPAPLPNPPLPSSALPVADLPSGTAGPMAGIAAALAALNQRGIDRGLLLSVAVDTPFLRADFAAGLLAGIGDASAAVASWRGNNYPTNALWRIEQLAPMACIVGSPRQALARLEATVVEWHSPQDPFANLNTLADLLALQRRGLRSR